MSLPTADLRAVVLAGGLAYERDISLRSGRRVADALRRAGVEVALLDSDASLVAELQARSPDAVFVALHGESGEDGSLRTVLDTVGVRYVGSTAVACRAAWDKPIAKTLVAAAGLATPDWVVLPRQTFRELGATELLTHITRRLGMPLMVKPAHSGSALGAQRVDEAAELPAAMIGCFSYDDTVLIEPYVTGVEVSVSVIDTGGGAEALPAVEIVPPNGIFDYHARYTSGTTDYFTPARLPDEVTNQLSEAAVTAHQVLGLRDMSRMDAIVRGSGEIQFLEVNVSPGMTDTSLLPMAVHAAGLELGDIVVDLLRLAVAR